MRNRVILLIEKGGSSEILLHEKSLDFSSKMLTSMSASVEARESVSSSRKRRALVGNGVSLSGRASAAP